MKITGVILGMCLVLAVGSGCQSSACCGRHPCQRFCDSYGDLIDDIGELSPISRPGCDDGRRACPPNSCGPAAY